MGIITCAIVDVAISGTFTWSLIPISACVFGWLVLVPIIRYGIRGIRTSLILLSVLVIPFLLVLSSLIDASELLMPIGVWVSLISIIYLWIVFALFKIFRTRTFIAATISLMLTIPCTMAINFTLSRIVATPLFDVWSAISFAIVIALAAILIFIDFATRRNGKM